MIDKRGAVRYYENMEIEFEAPIRSITIDREKTPRYNEALAVVSFLADENQSSAAMEFFKCAASSPRYKTALRKLKAEYDVD